MQAVDSSGNVAMSNSKSLFFLDADPVHRRRSLLVPDAGGARRLHEPVVHERRRRHHQGATPTTTYSVDGAASEAYTGAPIRISGDGGHVITAFDTTTGLVPSCTSRSTRRAPTASIPVPDDFVQGPFPVTATFDDGERRAA